MEFTPCYIKTHKSGELREKIKSAYKILENCTLCPRSCEVNRLKGESGICKVGKDPMISSAGPHFGEEPPLVGRHGPVSSLWKSHGLPFAKSKDKL